MPLPVSWAQRRLWILAQLEPESVAYHCPGAVRLRGVLHVAALDAAVQAVVARHEVLRTTFTAVDGEPVQVVRAEGGVRVVIDDLRGLADAAQRAAALTTAEARAPFDLEQGPLLRVRVVRLADDEQVLLVTCRNSVSCGGVLVLRFRFPTDAATRRSQGRT